MMDFEWRPSVEIVLWCISTFSGPTHTGAVLEVSNLAVLHHDDFCPIPLPNHPPNFESCFRSTPTLLLIMMMTNAPNTNTLLLNQRRKLPVNRCLWERGRVLPRSTVWGFQGGKKAKCLSTIRLISNPWHILHIWHFHWWRCLAGWSWVIW